MTNIRYSRIVTQIGPDRLPKPRAAPGPTVCRGAGDVMNGRLTEAERQERLRSLRKKMEKLNRGPLKAAARPSGPPRKPSPPPPAPPPAPPPPASSPRPGPRSAPKAVTFRRDAPRVSASPAGSRKPPRDPVLIEDCTDGCECADGPGPPFYLVEAAVIDLEPRAGPLAERLAATLEHLASLHSDVKNRIEPVPLGRVCFLDLETTGLTSSPVFLIGMLLYREGEMICRQLLARTYAEEVSIVGSFAATAAETDLYVTFNGKSFDVPYLRARAAATGNRLPEVDQHIDLLHVARRCYRGRLPDCRLQTLERHVCGRLRGPDVPGSEIPAVYHEFVRTKDATVVAQVLRHNFFDLVTLADLMVRTLLPK